MHETALAIGLLDHVHQALRAEGARMVTAIHVEIGALSCVETEAFAQAVRAGAHGGPAQDAHLLIERPAGHARCMSCGDDVPLLQRGDPCPQCGSYKLLVTGGDAMRLTAIEVL